MNYHQFQLHYYQTEKEKKPKTNKKPPARGIFHNLATQKLLLLMSYKLIICLFLKVAPFKCGML